MRTAAPMAAAWCLLVLHSPDGSPLIIASESIKVIRPVTPNLRAHVTKHTNAIVYAGVRPTGFGVMETATVVGELIQQCEHNLSK